MKQISFYLKYIFLFVFLLFIKFNIQAQAFTLDTTFNINYDFYALWGDLDPKVYGLNYEPDGKLMIYGYFWDGGTIADVLRLYEDGSLDNSWQFIVGGQGILFLERLNNVYIMGNGISGGYFDKLNYTGQLTDLAWGHNLLSENTCGEYYIPYFFSDGSMLVGSDGVCNLVQHLTKFLPDGTVDTNFRHTTNNTVWGITKYSSDKLLLYGGGQNSFTKYDTTTANVMCRIDTLGNLDTTFKSIFISGYSNLKPLYIQNDGKIIIGIVFSIINCPSTLYLIRLNANGSLDSTFNNFNNVGNNSGGVTTACPTTDGGYLIGGEFTQYQGYLRNNIVKTDVNGFIDTTYFNGEGIDSVGYSGLYSFVYCIKKGTNDTYYVMGDFTHYNGVHVYPIIRLKGISAGINEIRQEKGVVRVYPNPTKDNLTIETNSNTEQRLEIVNLIGQTVYTNNINKKATINTSAFAKGIYILKLSSDKETVVRKFVKE
ncbi:MAG: T9SS type A sorting domain-containing protein [Bacteroidota bacterium]